MSLINSSSRENQLDDVNQRSLRFFRESVEDITGGDVSYRNTIRVPSEWWEWARKNSQPVLALEQSFVHVFTIKRSRAAIRLDSVPIKWMGEHGIGYVWSYKLKGRWYYTTMLENGSYSPEMRSPEGAVRGNASRPWFSWMEHPDNPHRKRFPGPK